MKIIKYNSTNIIILVKMIIKEKLDKGKTYAQLVKLYSTDRTAFEFDYGNWKSQGKLNEIMEFEDWLENNEEELTIECAETGADRELDFDFERFCEYRYEEYLKNG